MTPFRLEGFPPNHLMRAKWAPILMRPIFGSPEQFVIAVVVANANGYHIERANMLQRLVCLFGQEAEFSILIATSALDILGQQLARSNMEALLSFTPAFSGVTTGEVQEAQGHSLRQIAQTWMGSLSSLYSVESQIIEHSISTIQAAEAERSVDRLPDLVLEYVTSQRPGLVNFFSDEIKNQNRRRRRSNVSGVIIDFAGSNVVANFGTLAAANHATSVDRIKRRLWDLKIDRDSELGSMRTRSHEMIVQRPAANDPQISVKQASRISDALFALEEQADREEIRLRPMTTVGDIGDHILQLEAA